MRIRGKRNARVKKVMGKRIKIIFK